MIHIYNEEKERKFTTAVFVICIAFLIALLAIMTCIIANNNRETLDEVTIETSTSQVLEDISIPDKPKKHLSITSKKSEIETETAIELTETVPAVYYSGEVPYEYWGYAVGYTWDVAYGYRDDWAYGTTQAWLQSVWESYGCISDNNVMTINGKYLIACKNTFGCLGDWITFYFDDGSYIDCIMYDEKGCEDNATEWGHISYDGYNISVLEFYMVDACDSVPFMSSDNHLTYWTNHGQSPELY